MYNKVGEIQKKIIEKSIKDLQDERNSHNSENLG